MSGAEAMKLPIISFSPLFRVASFIVYHATLLLVFLFDVLVFGVRITGRKNLKERRAILISNHTLYLDPALVSHAIFPRRAYFSAMESTFHIPVLGAYIRLLGAFPFPDRNPLQRVLKPLSRAVTQRGFVHVFPEGEMTHMSREIGEFRSGAFYLSLHMDIPIIPILIIVKKRYLFGLMMPPRVTIRIEPPLRPAGFLEHNPNKTAAMKAMMEAARCAMQSALAAKGP